MTQFTDELCGDCLVSRAEHEESGCARFVPGVDLPASPTSKAHFAAVGSNVVMVDTTIATARSKTMALRIANALNRYIPGRRGF